jgi:hypothetical protein
MGSSTERVLRDALESIRERCGTDSFAGVVADTALHKADECAIEHGAYLSWRGARLTDATIWPHRRAA